MTTPSDADREAASRALTSRALNGRLNDLVAAAFHMWESGIDDDERHRRKLAHKACGIQLFDAVATAIAEARAEAEQEAARLRGVLLSALSALNQPTTKLDDVRDLLRAALQAFAAERLAQRDPTYEQLIAERDAATARAEAAEADKRRLDWLSAEHGTNVISDDGGRWAVSSDGMQPVPDPDQPFNATVLISTFVDPAEWKPNLRDAFDMAMRGDEHEAVSEEHPRERYHGWVGVISMLNELSKQFETAEAEVARWKAQFESTNAAGIGVVEKLAVAEERVRVLETTLNMIAESVIVSVAASPTEHRVTWGCGICQGEYHKSDRQEWYDHEAWYDHGAWCPRAKAAGRTGGTR